MMRIKSIEFTIFVSLPYAILGLLVYSAFKTPLEHVCGITVLIA